MYFKLEKQVPRNFLLTRWGGAWTDAMKGIRLSCGIVLKNHHMRAAPPAQIQETCGCRGFGWLTGPSAIMQQALFGFSGNSLNLGMTAMAAMQTCDVDWRRAWPGTPVRNLPMRMPGSGRGHGEDRTTESMLL
jgi:hypothetical protein